MTRNTSTSFRRGLSTASHAPRPSLSTAMSGNSSVVCHRHAELLELFVGVATSWLLSNSAFLQRQETCRLTFDERFLSLEFDTQVSVQFCLAQGAGFRSPWSDELSDLRVLGSLPERHEPFPRLVPARHVLPPTSSFALAALETFLAGGGFDFVSVVPSANTTSRKVPCAFPVSPRAQTRLSRVFLGILLRFPHCPLSF